MKILVLVLVVETVFANVQWLFNEDHFESKQKLFSYSSKPIEQQGTAILRYLISQVSWSIER